MVLPVGEAFVVVRELGVFNFGEDVFGVTLEEVLVSIIGGGGRRDTQMLGERKKDIQG